MRRRKSRRFQKLRRFHPELRVVAVVIAFVERLTGRWFEPSVELPDRDRPGLEARLNRRRLPSGAELHEVGPVGIRLHRPPEASRGRVPALLWIHGGGLVGGAAAMDDPFCQQAAKKLGILVAAVDYRLAPEYPFPTPLHDCHDALVWLAGRPDVDNRRIAVGGASAGGGLAAALALLARERQEVEVTFQLLSYPMLDDRTSLREELDDVWFPLWNNQSNRKAWEAYLGDRPGGPDVSGLASPARFGDLTDLPPAWIGVGSCDLFHDEDVAYAERLRQAGVPCRLEVVQGAFHGFDVVRRRASISLKYRDAELRALAAALYPWSSFRKERTWATGSRPT